jgi:hypothetical protein
MRIMAPVRVSRSYTQTLEGTPEEVFPLLCPVREREWVEGWDPELVVSASGVAERDCVFITPDGARQATWVITEHEPAAGRVEMIKVTPGYLVIRLRITVRPLGGGAAARQTAAEVSYQYTALDEEGAAFVAGRTEAAYATFMRAWEDALNRFLRQRRAGG